MKPLTQFPTRVFSINWVEMDSMGRLMEKELIGQLYPQSSIQWPRVSIDISDKWGPSGACTGTSYSISPAMTQTLESSAPSANFQMTLS